MEVIIPSGIKDGQKLRLKQKGKTKNYQTGDLILEIIIENKKPQENENYYDNDLVVYFDLPLKMAMFGGKIIIPVNGKNITLTIPENTKTNQKFRVKEMGKFNEYTNIKGDLYLISNIIIPKISTLDKTLIKNLKTRLPD